MGSYPFAPAPADGETILVPPPTGLTVADTPAILGAIARLTAAGGNLSLQFQDGTYQVDSNALVIRSCSNFAIRGTGATFITQAPNRAALPNNVTGDLFIIADCTDFRVSDLTLDGLRDTVAPLTPLTASASSGQPSVTVAAGQGSRYFVNQRLSLYGGTGTADATKSDGQNNGWGGPGLVILSITPGGGSGGGDLITFTTNLASSYTITGGVAVSDGFGPYSWTSDYLTPYQCGYQNSVAGRSLSGEDQQNGLHLMNCQRFTISRITVRNLWESPVKIGNGFISAYPLISAADGCNNGVVTDCTVYHAYDQGISVWCSQNITVKGCLANAPGWGGVVLTSSDYCSVIGNQCLNSVYRVPPDTADGNGIAVEGGRFNTIADNVITGAYANGIRLWGTPLAFGISVAANCPTTSTFLAANTAAGTSIQVSSTTHLQAPGQYSIIDGSRTEFINVASIVDGSHVTLAQPLQFAHASGVYIAYRACQDNIVGGNIVDSPQSNVAIANVSAVRTIIKSNQIRNWNAAGLGSNAGVSLIAGTSGAITYPATNPLGGNGSQILDNTFGLPVGAGGGGLLPIIADSTEMLLIRGNQIWGPSVAGSTAAIKLQGVFDSAVLGNLIHDDGDSTGSSQSGIFLTVGAGNSLTCARMTIGENIIRRTKNEGLIVLGGDSLTIRGNAVSSCGGNAGINLRGVTNSLIADNVCNSNHGAGIQLEEQVTTGCSNCRVIGNTCRDDGSGVNVATGAAWTQANGIVEVAPSNVNLFVGNEVDANGTAQLTVVGAGSITHYNIVSGAITA